LKTEAGGMFQVKGTTAVKALVSETMTCSHLKFNS
jgi:hypothetical protein